MPTRKVCRTCRAEIKIGRYCSAACALVALRTKEVHLGDQAYWKRRKAQAKEEAHPKKPKTCVIAGIQFPAREREVLAERRSRIERAIA